MEENTSTSASTEQPLRALVIGLGIAGMSTALALNKAGWDVEVIERSPKRRTGGYFIGLSKEGFDAATYLGVDQDLATRTPEKYQTWEIDRHNTRRPSMNFTDQPNHPEVVLRGDIEEALWPGVDDNVTVRFNTTAESIHTAPTDTLVTLKDHNTGEVTQEHWDLVVGADGMRSSVRRAVFGAHEQFMKPVGSIICAFQMSRQVPGTADTDGLIAAEQGRALWVFPFSNRPPTALFTYRPDDVDAQFPGNRTATLREAYRGMKADGAVEFVLEQFERAENYLFDSVHTVDMPTWSKDRVVMLGDAAWCLTLYSGYGATSAMHGAAQLGRRLTAAGTDPQRIAAALADWEADLRPFIGKHRRLTAIKSQAFVPSNRVTYALRSTLLTRGVLPKTMAFVAGRQKRRKELVSQLFGERTA